MGSKAPAIISLEEFNESINMLVYGDPGVGKTVFGGSCPNAIFLAIEAGTVAAKRQGSKADLWPIAEWNDLQEAYDWLEANPDAYDWIIIDTATEMQRMCMRGILSYAVSENSSRDIDTPQIQDWTVYYNRFQRFVTAFNALPTNVLWLAHSMHKEDEEGDSIVLPEISGPSHSPLREAQMFCAAMNVIAYYKKSADGRSDDAATSRSLLFESMPPYIAKDRYDVFPRWVKVTESPDGKTTKQLTTMASVQKLIEGSTTVTATRAPAKAATAKASPVRRRPTR